MNLAKPNTVDDPGQADAVGPENYSQLWAMPSYLLNRISHRYSQNIHDCLKERGLTTLNVRIIVALRFYGKLTVNELCIHAIAEQSAMSRALDRLEKEGYISRSVSEKDSRARIVRPLGPAKELFEDIFPVMRDANEEMLAGLSAEERMQLLGLLTKVLKKFRTNPV